MCSQTENGYYKLGGDDSPFYSRIYDTFFADIPKVRDHDQVKFNQQQQQQQQQYNRLALLAHPASIPDAASLRSCVQPTTDPPRAPGGQIKKQKRKLLSQDQKGQKRQEIIPEAPMDASSVFRQVQGFGAYIPRPPQGLQHKKPMKVEDQGDGEASHRIAHTLTACCRCRQVSTCFACSSTRRFSHSAPCTTPSLFQR
ncbi:hypothetical protein M434DRAFT_100410 [Hypoxylon sp. CO27-5]|nr:hypothetical protein M434DRAFT_100410 [Hypoxylon sp. CO27-5]